jgi:PAS domain S-box-containing protein
MAAAIAFIEAPAALVALVRSTSPHPVAELEPARELPEVLRQPTAFVAVAVGPHVTDAVEMAQRVGQTDPQLAVVILRNHDDVATTGRSLQFAPFLGEDVSCRRAESDEVTANAVMAAATRTARRRAHRAALRAAAERVGAASAAIAIAAPSHSLGTLLDQAPVGVVTVDAAGIILSANRYVERLFEVRPAELAHRSLVDLFPVEAQSRLHVLLTPGTPLFPSATRRFARQRSDGATQELDVTAARFTSAAGEPGSILLLQEVTERAHAERVARRQALNLQEGVIKRLVEARAAVAEGEHDGAMASLDEAVLRARALARQIVAGSASEDRDDRARPPSRPR